MNESPQQYFLTQASKQLDFVGPTNYDKSMSLISHTLNYLKKDPTNLWDCLDLVRHLACYTGGLWRNSPTALTEQVPDLIAPPDNTINLEGIEYDKAVLEILIDRCARLPRQENTSLAAPDYETPGWDYDTLDYVPATTTTTITETLTVYSEALRYETAPAPLLNILLSDAWELYLRSWEHTNA